MQLPFGSGDTTTIALIAYAEDDAGRVWSVFPTTNVLNPAGGLAPSPLRLGKPSAEVSMQQTSWQDAFFWDDLANDVPNANQPRAFTVDVEVSSPQSAVGAWGANNSLTYNVLVTNQEGETLTGLGLTFTPDSAVTINGSDVIAIPALGPGESYLASITGQLNSSLTGLSETVMTVALDLNSAVLQQTTYSHTIDSLAPTLTIATKPGQVLGLGSQTIIGTATDGKGAGLDKVEVSTNGSSWQTATGRSVWTAAINVAGGTTLDVYARAVDLRGNTSAPVMVTFVVDSVAPTTTLVVPASVTSAFALITGVAADPAPAGAEVAPVTGLR